MTFSWRQQPAEALKAYQRSLDLYPKRFSSLLGTARAARALGRAPVARAAYQALLEVSDGGTREPAFTEARAYIARRR